MQVRNIFVLVLGLALLLPILSYQVAQQRQVLAKLDADQQRLLQKSQRITTAHQQREVAVRFMAEAQGFVDKAQRLGVRQGEINSYKIDFRQLVETGRIPQLLDQSRSANGRHFSPRLLEISRNGMSLSRELKERVVNAQKHRNDSYRLAFAGDVLVVADEK